MDLVVWKLEYSVGVKEIDAQHRRLVQIIRALQESMRDNPKSPAVGQTLKELVDYTKTHFRDEETLMRRISYPDLAEHQQRHSAMILEVIEILRQVKAGKEYTAPDMVAFLKKWLFEHIQGEDTRIAEALHNKLQEVRAAR